MDSLTRKDDFYQELRQKLKKWLSSPEGETNKWAEYLMFAPDLFHLLGRLFLDRDVPVADKAKVAAAIAYFISPLDMIPEALVGPVGYIDDIAVAVLVLNNIINHTSPEIVRRHWAGEGDVIEVIRKILTIADEMIGSGLWRKLKKWF